MTDALSLSQRFPFGTRTSPRPVRHLLAIAIGMMVGTAFAQQDASVAADAGAAAADGGTAAVQQPITEQGISGELMHTLLGLYMVEADLNGVVKEVAIAYPATGDWKRDPDPNPAWPTVRVFQMYQTAQGQFPPESDRTPDGHFVLARSSFLYTVSTSTGGYDGDLPQGTPPEWFLDSAGEMPVEVNDTGIVLGSSMRVVQDTTMGEREYELKAESARTIARTDIVPFKQFIQSYRGDGAGYHLKVEKGREPRQVKLCWSVSGPSLDRDACHVWSVPNNWTFGKALNYDRAEVADGRWYFPSELSGGGYQRWITESQPWPRL